MAGLLCYLIWYKPFAHQSTNPLGIKPPDRWNTTRKTETASDVAYLCKYTCTSWVCVCVWVWMCGHAGVWMYVWVFVCGWQPMASGGCWTKRLRSTKRGDCKSEQKINEQHLPADKLYGIIHFEPQFAYVSAPSGYRFFPQVTDSPNHGLDSCQGVMSFQKESEVHDRALVPTVKEQSRAE